MVCYDAVMHAVNTIIHTKEPAYTMFLSEPCSSHVSPKLRPERQKHFLRDVPPMCPHGQTGINIHGLYIEQGM